MPISHRAYAKINLALYVTGKRPDGYHNILTLFHRVNLFDEITLGPAATIEVTSTSPDAPGGETNLCHKAAVALQHHLGVTSGTRIHVVKHIPVGAGLGGGSSDAAVVLQQLPSLWGRTVPESDLRSIALALGSDVPYFLGQGSAIARGRGEALEYIHLDVPFAILLCNPNIHVSTAWAYQHVKPGAGAAGRDFLRVVQHGMSDPALLTDHLQNDFEEPVFRAYPVIRQVKQEMLAAGAFVALMSGSGSTVFGLFSGAEAAQGIERVFRERGYRTFLTEPHFHP